MPLTFVLPNCADVGLIILAQADACANWGMKYIALYYFNFPVAFLNSAQVILFKKNFENSIDFYNDLLQSREEEN